MHQVEMVLLSGDTVPPGGYNHCLLLGTGCCGPQPSCNRVIPTCCTNQAKSTRTSTIGPNPTQIALVALFSMHYPLNTLITGLMLLVLILQPNQAKSIWPPPIVLQVLFLLIQPLSSENRANIASHRWHAPFTRCFGWRGVNTNYRRVAWAASVGCNTAAPYYRWLISH